MTTPTVPEAGPQPVEGRSLETSVQRWQREQEAPDRYEGPPGSQPDSILCRLGLHQREVIPAIDHYIGPFLNDRECMFPVRMAGFRCPGTSRVHRHVDMPWCSRCGELSR